ncbi:hypothetical protein TWF225_005900 [Orbilia oligospora]|nr:hypothetical protein TWF751_003386 [Orbilia oligospora]KAF3184607.1 hypothetical protein TWF225_005900 [Orbilia oligospora]KAF3288148.1 hypothetical protein TWF132_007974 [Orbilia oligospora]
MKEPACRTCASRINKSVQVWDLKPRRLVVPVPAARSVYKGKSSNLRLLSSVIARYQEFMTFSMPKHIMGIK